MSSRFLYTSGTAPQEGIDIEPDAGDVTESITIKNCVLAHNASGGVSFVNAGSNNSLVDNVIENNPIGVYFVGTSNFNETAEGNAIAGATYGIMLSGAHRISIRNNVISNPIASAFVLESAADQNVIENNSCRMSPTDKNGTLVSNSTGNLIRYNVGCTPPAQVLPRPVHTINVSGCRFCAQP